MSMWEPRSSHLYVGRGVACRLWLLCFLCVRGAGAHTAPLRPPRLEAGGRVCVCACVPVFSVLLCTPVCVPLWICACSRGFVCARPPRACAVPCSTCVLVRAVVCGCAVACARGRVSNVCTCVCLWVFLCA